MTTRMLAFAPILFALPAHADGLDYERARDALERNEVLPLARILPSGDLPTGAPRELVLDGPLDETVLVLERRLIPGDRVGDLTRRGVRLDQAGPGAGLGLAIAHEIADAAGGTLQLANTDPGVEARLVLPGAT
jgi:hypothetical protein